METDVFPIIQNKLTGHRITCCNRFKKLDFSIKPFVQNKLFNINVFIKKTLKNIKKTGDESCLQMSGNDGLWSDVKCDAVEPTPSVLCELLVPGPIHNLTKGFFSFG
jgi:hypothetical protein